MKLRSILTMPLLLLAAITASARAQTAAPANTVSYKGVVATVLSNRRCFTLLDKKGNSLTINLSPATKYLVGQVDAKWIDVLVVGDKVTADIGPGDLAVDVIAKNKGSKITSATLKDALGISDDECEVLLPFINKMQAAQRLTLKDGVSGSNVRTAFDSLHAAIQDPHMSQADFRVRLKALRDARNEAKKQVEKSRQDLIALLTLQQEATLVQMGILD